MRTLEAANRLARRAIDRVHGYGVINRGGRGVVGLIDVGSVGALPRPWHQRCDLVRNVLKFEPRDPGGETSRVVTIDAALRRESATLPFYVYAGQAGTGSSLFRPNVDYVRDNFDVLRTFGPTHLAETWFERSRLDRIEEVHCTTLDAVLAERSESYHLLKIDAQGAERQILEGSADYLSGGDCQALHLELFRLPLYVGIALRSEVQRWLRAWGSTSSRNTRRTGRSTLRTTASFCVAAPPVRSLMPFTRPTTSSASPRTVLHDCSFGIGVGTCDDRLGVMVSYRPQGLMALRKLLRHVDVAPAANPAYARRDGDHL